MTVSPYEPATARVRSVPSPQNPFRPGVNCPPVMAGREAQLAAVRARLSGGAGLLPNVRIVGLRGMGKTCLMTVVREEAEKEGWIVVHRELTELHNGEYPLAQLLVSLIDQAKRRLSLRARLRAAGVAATMRLLAVVRVKVDQVEFSFDASAGKVERDLASALADGVQVAVRSGHAGLVVLLDEAHQIFDEDDRGGERPLSVFIAALTEVQRAGLPVFAALAGLPRLNLHLNDARSNALRMFEELRVGALDDAAARTAFTEAMRQSGLDIEQGALQDLIDETGGIPYFVQVWGAAVWNAANAAGTSTITRATIDQVRYEVYEDLDASYYEGNVADLDNDAQALLRAAAECRYPLQVAELAKRSDLSRRAALAILQRLTDDGLVRLTGPAQYSFTVPQFFEYLQRAYKGP
jgi:hypothetical protein